MQILFKHKQGLSYSNLFLVFVFELVYCEPVNDAMAPDAGGDKHRPCPTVLYVPRPLVEQHPALVPRETKFHGPAKLKHMEHLIQFLSSKNEKPCRTKFLAGCRILKKLAGGWRN